MEIWKDVESYKGIYKVSNTGKIKSIDRNIKMGSGFGVCKGKTLSDYKDKDGYLVVSLSNKSKYKLSKVHRVVASAFIPNPLNLPQVNHKDGVKTNNHVDNLEWCDGFHNMRHANRTGLVNHKKGDNHHRRKVSSHMINVLKRYLKIYPNANRTMLAKKLNITRSYISVLNKN